MRRSQNLGRCPSRHPEGGQYYQITRNRAPHRAAATANRLDVRPLLATGASGDFRCGRCSPWRDIRSGRASASPTGRTGALLCRRLSRCGCGQVWTSSYLDSFYPTFQSPGHAPAGTLVEVPGWSRSTKGSLSLSGTARCCWTAWRCQDLFHEPGRLQFMQTERRLAPRNRRALRGNCHQCL
jgi:hypothetical protein